MEPSKQQIINCVYYKFEQKIDWINGNWGLVNDDLKPNHDLYNDIIKYISELTNWYHNIVEYIKSDIKSKYLYQDFEVIDENNEILIYLNSEPNNLVIYESLLAYHPFFKISVSPPIDAWK